jgi:hypothetical protein
MESWSSGPIPPPVGKAAAAHGLGGPVTRATTNRLTPTRSYLITVSWGEVAGMRAERTTIRVERSCGAVLPLFRDRTPHQRTVMALGAQLSAGARRAGQF